MEVEQALKKSLCIFGTLSCCVMVLFLIDLFSYETDPMWRSYREFNMLRTELLDYGFPDPEENRDLYDSLDINEDAFQLYSSWNFNDPDKFNVQVMEELVEAKPKKKFTVTTITSFLDVMPQILKNTYTFWCVCILLILWMVWGGNKRKTVFCLAYVCGVSVIAYLYLFYKGRYGVNRVDVGIWYSVSLVLAYLLYPYRAIKKRKIPVIWTLLLCVLTLWIGGRNCRPYLWIYHQEDGIQRAAYREVLEALGMDKRHLYLIKAGCIPEYNCYGTFDPMPGGILDNICWLAGWDCNTSGQLDVLGKFGVMNPYKDLIDRGDVILIDDDIDLTVRYIREYYDKNAKAEFIKTVGNVNLYRIIS